jgi:hypothetical protein
MRHEKVIDTNNNEASVCFHCVSLGAYTFLCFLPCFHLHNLNAALLQVSNMEEEHKQGENREENKPILQREIRETKGV